VTTLAMPHRASRPFAQLLRTELTLFRRNAGAVLWTAFLPLVALVVVGSIHALRVPSKNLHGISYLAAYLPILMIFSVCMSTVNLLPPTLALYREKGVLRRLSTTPLPPSRLLLAQASIYLALALAVSVVMLVLCTAFFGVAVPDQLPGFLVSLLLVGTASTSIGLLIAAVSSGAKAANAVSMAAFFPLMFLAGLWVPRAVMPHLLRTFSDWSPLGAGVRALQDSVAGHFPPAQSLLVLVAYTVVCGALAARTFRWE
jgi:ABC-2 type transport system permease protein